MRNQKETMEIKVTTATNTNDEPNPPIWSDSVKIFRPPGTCKTKIDLIQQELYKFQDPEITYHGENMSQPQQKCFTCADHFSRRRTALLFAPGIYPNIHFEIGYYVQILGLGKNVNDVQFQLQDEFDDTKSDNTDSLKTSRQSRFVGPYVPALNKHIHKRDNGNRPVGTSLDSFWRGAENFTIGAVATSTETSKTDDDRVKKAADMLWAASQAAAIRRIHVTGDLYLHDHDAYASGGHLANAQVDGTIFMGGQQQYLVRNVEIGTNATGGAWSMVYVGCTGNVPEAETKTSNGRVVTVVDKPRVRIEKPYIVMRNGVTEKEDQFELRVPQVNYWNDSSYTTDPTLDGNNEEIIHDFTNIRVVRDSEPLLRIQQALDDGKDVILCPGIYILQESIKIRKPNQILFGLGMATLIAPANGTPCIVVAYNTPGVRLAGLMLEATKIDCGACTQSGEVVKESSALLVWGDIKRNVETVDAENRKNPGAMFDIYIRVGGAFPTKNGNADRTKVSVNNMMYIHSDFVIGDNLWLWRADHAELGSNERCNYPSISPIFWQTESDEYRVQNGLVVTGNDVTIFGLAVEHTKSHQTIWSGERGAVYFYQCELPYDTITEKDGTHENCQNMMDAFIESSDASNHGTTIDIRGFHIKPNVEEHTLYAPGIYSNFRNEEMYTTTGIVHPNHPLVKVINPFTIKLDNLGGIKSVINGKGNSTDKQGVPCRIDEST